VGYRSTEDILVAMLETATGGALKTRIMYKAVLSFPRLNEYLKLLLDLGMLEYIDNEKIYNTTEKGKQFLKTYKKMSEMVPRKNILTKIA
jgi:predicted transcriptional regulator